MFYAVETDFGHLYPSVLNPSLGYLPCQDNELWCLICPTGFRLHLLMVSMSSSHGPPSPVMRLCTSFVFLSLYGTRLGGKVMRSESETYIPVPHIIFIYSKWFHELILTSLKCWDNQYNLNSKVSLDFLCQ